MDGRSLYGYTNHQAVEVLRNTAKIVKLRLARYLRGSKYEQLQQAIATPDPPSPYYSQSIPGSTVIQIYDQSSESVDRQTIEGLDSINEIEFGNQLQSNDELRTKWEDIVGPNFEIVVRIINKTFVLICIK